MRGNLVLLALYLISPTQTNGKPQTAFPSLEEFHRSLAEEERDGLFTAMCRLFDLVFGTEEVPLVLLLSSVGGAAEIQGGRLGEFHLSDENLYRGKVKRYYFQQRHTIDGRPNILYYSVGEGTWKVSQRKGDQHTWLWYHSYPELSPQQIITRAFAGKPKVAPLPPLNTPGWGYWKNGEWMEHGDQMDSSLVLTASALEPCSQVHINASGDAASHVSAYMGVFLPTGDWSSGRPVYRQQKETNGKYLFVKAGYTQWTIWDGLDMESAGWVSSGKATNDPAHPSAAIRESEGHSQWRYNDGVEWKNGDILVTCQN